MSKSQEVIEYVKALREEKLLWEDLATQSEPIFPAVDEQALQVNLEALKVRQSQLQAAYAAIRTSDTESLLLSRVLMSGKQVCVELEELRASLKDQHPSPTVLALQSARESLQIDILRLELELEERGTTTLLDKLMGVVAPETSLEPEPLLVGSLIDSRYRVDESLYQGDRGAVYKVSDQNTPQQWVVKEIWGLQRFLTPAQISRLDAQVRRLSAMRHPSLPRIVDAMEENGRYFIVTDVLSGLRLEDALRGSGSMPLERALPIALQLVEAVLYLHQQEPPFVVGHLSSRHVLLEASGQIKLSSSDLTHCIDQESEAETPNLGMDHQALARVILEILSESGQRGLSGELLEALHKGEQGHGLQLDDLLQRLGEELSRLRKEAPEVSMLSEPEPAAVGREAEQASTPADGARGSKLSVFYRGVKRVVEKITTNVG